MATTDCTLRYRFAKSKFSAITPFKPFAFHSIDQLMIKLECISAPNVSPLLDEPVFDDTIAELMENLRVHMNAVLRLPLPVQKRRCLVRHYWELEYRVKQVRLLLDPAALAVYETAQTDMGISQSP